MKSLNTQIMKQVIVAYPPLFEQQKIVSILSTWDRAIELKEQLIEEKKKLKKGLMQNLLTGKVRLPGFEGEWKEVKFQTIGRLKGGSGFPEKYQNNISGKYPFYKVSDMNLVQNSKFMTVSNNYIDEAIKEEIKASILPANSIIFAKVGAALLLDRKRILQYESCIDNNLMGFIVDEKVAYYMFIYYFLLTVQLGKLSNMGALPSLNAGDVYKFKITIPKIDEQKAITAIIENADREPQLLQQELDLLKQQKNGLMQLLLTGIVRVNTTNEGGENYENQSI